MSVQTEKRVVNVNEYHKMLDAGILSEHDLVELIDGEVLSMSPIGKRHAACVKRLNALLNQRLGHRALVSVQNPIQLDDHSEPQPDIALLKPRADFYSQSLPVAADVLLIVEVADTSVEYDRIVRLPLYARAGISEVWLADLPGDAVEMYSEPADGAYGKRRRTKRSETFEPTAFPDMQISVEEILG